VVTPQVTSTGQLTFQANSVTVWVILGGGNGSLIPAADNAVDLGITGTSRVRSGFFGTSVVTPLVDTGSAASLILQPNATPTLKIVAVGSTNFANVQGAATTFAPVIFANGSDTNISMIFSSKGTGSLDFATEGTFTGDINSNRVVQFRVIDTPGATRFLTATGSTTNPVLDASAGAIRLSAGTADIQWGKANVAVGGGASPTFGTIGATGPAAAAQRNWLRFIESDGTASFIPVWR
jgi:hypothetical protein